MSGAFDATGFDNSGFFTGSITSIARRRTPQLVPVDARQRDWPRVAANRINEHERQLANLATYSRVLTASETVLDSDYLLLVDAAAGAVTVSLPALAARQIVVKKIDASANAVTVDAAGSDTIDGAGNYSLPAQYNGVWLAGGSEWHILAAA